MKRKKFSIVVPCYNEAENIENLVTTLEKFPKKYDVEFILVENGSKDNSKEIFKKIKSDRIKVVYVKENQGYGFGVLSGLKAAEGDFVGWIHADLQVKPKYLLEMFEFAEKSENDKLFLKGKRKNRSLIEHFFTNGMTIFETLLHKTLLNDIGAIPVVFNKELLKDFELPPNNFALELYSFYKARKAGYKVKRFKVILEQREKGASSWNKGLKSRINLSKTMIKDSLKIKRGEYK
jgi:glycosyltransferase involved in cell wall biosynthesis